MFKHIRDLREDRDLSQQYIADMLHISRSVYTRYENGDGYFSVDMLIKLSYFYGVNVDYLVDLTNVKEPYPRAKENMHKI